jgi:hypothetical protein
MRSKYRRSNGSYYAQDCETGRRESLGIKNEAEAGNLLRAKNESFVQPVFNREMAKVYLRGQDPERRAKAGAQPSKPGAARKDCARPPNAFCPSRCHARCFLRPSRGPGCRASKSPRATGRNHSLRSA